MAQSPDTSRISAITRRYYLLGWFYAFGGGFVYGVYPLFLRARGLSELQANSVLATYFLITFLTDVPTGAFADALSRRSAFLLACLLRSLGFGLYFFAHTYPVFLLGETIDAIGTTFGNGAVDAWAVDRLDDAGFRGLKDRIFSRCAQLTTAGWLISALLGSYIADVNLAWPWLFGTAGYVLCLLVGSRLMGGHGGPHKPIATAGQLRGLIGDIGRRARSGIEAGFDNRAVLMLTAAGAASTAAWAPYWMAWPQFFAASLGKGFWIIGWLFCFFSLGRLLGSEAIVLLQPSRAGRAKLITALAIAVGLLLIGSGAAGSHLRLMLALLFVMNICSGAIQPVTSSWINEHLEADRRATLLSFQSTFATLGGAIGLLLCGWAADRWGLLVVWYLAGTSGLLAAFFYSRLRTVPDRAESLPTLAAGQ